MSCEIYAPSFHGSPRSVYFVEDGKTVVSVLHRLYTHEWYNLVTPPVVIWEVLCTHKI